MKTYVGHVTKNELPRCVGFVNMSVEPKSKTKRQNFVLNQELTFGGWQFLQGIVNLVTLVTSYQI